MIREIIPNCAVLTELALGDMMLMSGKVQKFSVILILRVLNRKGFSVFRVRGVKVY